MSREKVIVSLLGLRPKVEHHKMKNQKIHHIFWKAKNLNFPHFIRNFKSKSQKGQATYDQRYH